MKDHKGHKNPCWKGGKRQHSAGYTMVYSSDHPRAIGKAENGGAILEHILIAEKALGKPLPVGVPIHHYGEKTENHKIVICQDAAYHTLLHQRTRLIQNQKTGGKVCTSCLVHKPFDQFYRDTSKFDQLRSQCKACILQFRKEKYRENQNRRIH
jgi:hypothetical protein